MTTYTAIPDSDIDPESPITTGLMTLLRDNPLAIGEGASGAPRVQGAGLVEFTAGNYVVGNPISWSGKALGTSKAKIAEFKVGRSGTISTYISISTSNFANSAAQIYKNGVAAGTDNTWSTNAVQTFTEDIAVSAGDLLQLYASDSGSNNTTGTLTIKAGTVIDAGEIHPAI